MAESIKILITGTSGRLGTVLARRYEDRFELSCPGRDVLDLARPETVAASLAGMEFDLLINSAGVTSPDACVRDPSLAMRVNAESPAVMAAVCQRRGARMIQISTDYVFGGESVGLLDESCPAEPVNDYGRSKREGELAVLAACPRACVARVSWLFGGGGSFPDQMIRQAREGDEIEAISDKWSAPTSVLDVAQWLEALWQKAPEVTGYVHLCNSGSASWQDYGQTVLEMAHELGLISHCPIVKGNRLTDFPHFIARRPRHTVMSNARLAELLGSPVRTWQAALRDWMQTLVP